MAYKLAIEDTVYVPVKGKLSGSTKDASKPFNFGLFMRRMEQEQVDVAMKSNETIPDFLVAHTTGWQDQRLVLNADDTPAEYCEEAMRALLRFPHMNVWVFQAYLQAVGVQAKN